MRNSVIIVTAASQDWGLGFGPVTVGRERAKRAPDLWLPPPNLKPQSWRASKERRGGEDPGGNIFSNGNYVIGSTKALDIHTFIRTSIEYLLI